jgi:hypothetical protein
MNTDVVALSNRVSALEGHEQSRQAELQTLRTEITTNLQENLTAHLEQRLQELGRAAPNLRVAPNLQPPRAAAFRPTERFIARKFFLKGWARWGEQESHGINSAKAANLWRVVAEHIPEQFRRYLDPRGPSHPARRNTQIVMSVIGSAPDNVVYDICDAVNQKLRDNNVTLMGRQLYVQYDSEEWVKERRRNLAKARAVAEENIELAAGYTLTPDWPTGKLYVSKDDGTDILVGAWYLTKGWEWMQVGITKVMELLPPAKRVDIATLDVAMTSR